MQVTTLFVCAVSSPCRLCPKGRRSVGVLPAAACCLRLLSPGYRGCSVALDLGLTAQELQKQGRVPKVFISLSSFNVHAPCVGVGA